MTGRENDSPQSLGRIYNALPREIILPVFFLQNLFFHNQNKGQTYHQFYFPSHFKPSGMRIRRLGVWVQDWVAGWLERVSNVSGSIQSGWAELSGVSKSSACMSDYPEEANERRRSGCARGEPKMSRGACDGLPGTGQVRHERRCLYASVDDGAGSER